MEKYNWWTEAQKKLAGEAEVIVDDIMPRYVELAWEKKYPRELANVLAKAGWFGSLIPKKYGGRFEDWGITGTCIIHEELGRCGEVATVVCPTMIGGTHQIVHDGTEAQKQRWLPKIARGELFCAVCMTEPYVGSDLASIETTAKRDGEYYILNGKKRFTTNLGGADLYMVYAKSSDEPDDKRKYRHLTALIVEKGTSGFSVEKVNDLVGLDGAYNGYLNFDNARVPAANRLLNEGDGWKVMMGGLNVERLLSAAEPLGSMREVLRWAVYHMQRRVQFGIPTIEQPVNQQKVADMIWHLTLCRLAVYHTAHIFDTGGDAPLEAAMMKLVTSDALMSDSIAAMQCMGGDGVTKYYPVDRIMRKAKVSQVAAGTNEVARMVLCRQGIELLAKDLEAPQRVISEKLGIPITVGKEKVRPLARGSSGEQRLLEVFAENYRVNPGLYMTRHEMKSQAEMNDEELNTHLASLEKKGLAKTYKGRKGDVSLARATYEGLARARSKEYYRYIPDWVTKEDVFNG